MFLERWFSLVTCASTAVWDVRQDRLLVSCCGLNEVTMHTCCMVQVVASKTFGSVVLSPVMADNPILANPFLDLV